MSKPSERRRGRAWRSAGAAALLSTCLSSSSAAESADPSLPIELPVGIDRELPRLPAEPKLRWQARLNEPLAGAPARDRLGRLMLAHSSGTLTALDAEGRSSFVARTSAPAVTGPVLLAGGACLVLTAESDLVTVSPRGRTEQKSRLPFRDLDGALPPVPTHDGGALVAAGTRFARIGPKGRVAFAGQVREALRGVFEWRGLSLLVERTGRVLARGHAGDPYELASFPKPVSELAAHGDRLLAIAGSHELLVLDLAKKRASSLFSEPQASLSRLIALPSGATRMIVDSGTLLGTDRDGRETLRAVLRVQTTRDPLAALAADESGSTLVALAGLDLTVVAPSGEIKQLAGTACPDPLPPVALGNLWIATCRSGLAFAVSDKAR